MKTEVSRRTDSRRGFTVLGIVACLAVIAIASALVLFLLRPRFKPGPQWLETDSGFKIWVNCPAKTTNVVWSGKANACVATGPGNLKICFTDGSVLETNAVLRWGGTGAEEPNALEQKGFHFFGPVKNGKPRGFGVLQSPKGCVVGTFRTNGSAKGNVLEFDSADRLVYEGGFRRFAYHGNGSLHESGGARYEGRFKNGLKDGYGREWQSDGTRFKGYFKEGVRHGRGASTSSDGTRTWHVWRSGRIADREEALRARLDAAEESIRPKTKERFERYLCYFELNQWWMTTLVGILFFLVFLLGYSLGPEDPSSPFVEQMQKESELRRDFWRGAAFGWHKRRATRPEWFVYPTLLFAAVLFASKTLLLFVPFPSVWLRVPTFPTATVVCLAAYAALCIYDLRFGMGFDAYRFNWRWFWRPEYDEKLKTGNDEPFRIAAKLRSSAEMTRTATEKAKAEAEAIFVQLHEKHEKDDNALLGGFMPTWKEAFSHAEEAKTRELFDVVKHMQQLARYISSDGERAAGALNWFHFVFRRARNVSYEILDEAKVRPVVRQAYKRDFDRIDAVTVTIESMKAEELSRFNSELRAHVPIFGSIAAGFLNLGAAEYETFRLITGKETQLSKLRKDQDAAYESISKAVPELGKAYATIREAADRLDAVSEVIRQFFVHYVNVREKLLGSPSLSDYRRRRHGYKGREAVMSDEAVKTEFEPMLRFLMEMTKRFKRIDELRNLGDSSNPTNTKPKELSNHE